ncbi:MAG: acyltransferase [Eubacterium sp.]
MEKIMENLSKKQLPVKNGSSRNYGIDLLRCVAMAMIVMLHTLSRSGLLTKTEVGSLKYETVWLIEIICYCAVDCFVIISGYVGLNSKFRISRILLLWLQVEFYNVGLTVLMQAVDGKFNSGELIRSFFPVSTNAYWFFTQYFVLCFFMPFINKLVLNLSQKMHTAFVGMMLVFFSLLPMIYSLLDGIFSGFDEKIFYTERGYSVLWMIAMYSMGTLLNRLNSHGLFDKIKINKCILIIITSDLIIWVIHYFCVNYSNGISHYFIVSYTSPFVIVSAVATVILFSKLHFGKAADKMISFFSAGAFAVYLVHSNASIYKPYTALVSPMLNMRLLKLLPCLLFTVLFVFFACTVFDAVRGKLFALLRVDKLCKKLDGSVNLYKKRTPDLY